MCLRILLLEWLEAFPIELEPQYWVDKLGWGDMLCSRTTTRTTVGQAERPCFEIPFLCDLFD